MAWHCWRRTLPLMQGIASATGGGRMTSFASLRRFCAIAASVNSNWAPHGPRKRRRPSRKIRLRCAKQHLNTFAIATGSFECFGLGLRSRHVTGLLVEAALDSAQRHLWTALRFEEAAAAIACLSCIEKCFPIIDQLARRGENLAGRTNVNVLLQAEVFPTEGPILAL